MDFGTLPSLLSYALEPDPTVLLRWRRAASGHAAERIERRERILMVAETISVPLTTSSGVDALLRDAVDLVEAATVAISRGCRRLVWPVWGRGDLNSMADAVERGQIVEALFNNTQAGDQILIDLPVVDLTAKQVLQLLVDTGMPIDLGWPCLAEGNHICGLCQGCQDWLPAVESVGLPVPWSRRSASSTPPRS